MADTEELTQRAAAQRLGLTSREVRNLGEHDIPRLKNKRYPWPEVRDWRVQAG